MTGDVGYGDEHPRVALDARVHGDVSKQDWPDVGGVFAWVGGFLIWLAITLSLLVFGALLLLIAPRAADALRPARASGSGPTIAIGIAIAIVLPVVAFIAAITLVGLPLAVGIGLRCCRSGPSPTSSPPTRWGGGWSSRRATACSPSSPGSAPSASPPRARPRHHRRHRRPDLRPRPDRRRYRGGAGSGSGPGSKPGQLSTGIGG